MLTDSVRYRSITTRFSVGRADMVFAESCTDEIFRFPLSVMDRGRIAEYDSPAKLLADPKSKFHSLCRATGKAEFKTLKKMALDAEQRRKEKSISS